MTYGGAKHYFEQFQKQRMDIKMSWKYLETWKKRTIYAIVAVGVLVWLCNCSHLGLQKPPSVCDNVAPGASVLCDIVNDNDLHLETIGNLVMVANLRALKENAYTKAQALDAFNRVEKALEVELTAFELARLANQFTDDYPELLLLLPYVSYLETPTVLTGKDKEMLTYWIDQQRSLLQ